MARQEAQTTQARRFAPARTRHIPDGSNAYTGKDHRTAGPIGEARVGGAVAADQMARPGYGEILRIEPFRWLWLSTLLARLGNAIAQVALPLLVYDKTGSARLLGLIFVLEFLPNVVLSPITGLLADRLDRRRLMIGAASLRAGAVALLPLSPQVWQIAVLAAVIAIGSTISFPAEFAVVPTTLDPVQLVSGLSLMQVTNSTMRVIGPPVGAALIGGFGPGGAFWTESVCFAASIFALLRLTIPSAPVRIASTSGKTLVGEALDEIAVGLSSPSVMS
ncbi:MAG: MFS transporter [Solirubrobacteraceae bacterium]